MEYQLVKRKMKDKILFTVPNLKIIDECKRHGIKNFVYPFSFFCVGILNTFELKDIKEENSYLLINRVLNSEDINKLKDILKTLPENIKGIIFEDLGLIKIMQDLKLEKILFAPHLTTNFMSVNSYLRYVDTLIVSYDITEEEIREIVTKASKPISLFVFGTVSSMYSRRTLLSSYSKHYAIDYKNVKKLTVKDEDFVAVENNYGTVLYHMPYYNGLDLFKYAAKYYFYFPILMSDDDIKSLLNGTIENIPCDKGFLETKTIYKIKGVQK